jgi:hypothetical protein
MNYGFICKNCGGQMRPMGFCQSDDEYCCDTCDTEFIDGEWRDA